MRRDFSLQRKAMLAGLAALVLADAGLAFYSIHAASVPRTPQQELALEKNQLQLLKADVERARSIRKSVPDDQRECDEFEKSLLPASSGYSMVSADLNEVAKKAGLQIVNLSYHPKEIGGRGLTEVGIDAAVNGDYASVVRFLNGLQRSTHVYAVESLSLGNESSNQGGTGAVRVALHMKSYFRAG